jgi:hypothetical protein
VKEPIMMKALFASTIVSIFLVACVAEDADSLTGSPARGGPNGDDPSGEGTGDGTDDGTTPGSDPTQPGACRLGKPHPGFANFDFVSDRKAGAIGENRRRVKPFSALKTEFRRALGTVPASFDQSAAAFGQTPARWYSEPTAGAVSLNQTYNLAFTGCYDTMTGPEFQQAPTAETASAECAKMQRKFWQRTATPDEVKACADFALGLTNETVARRRWAHACASIMTSAGFTTY